MKINLMYLIIFLIFIISIYNIFYKNSIYNLFNFEKKQTDIINLPTYFDPSDKLFCSVSGYKCETENCDCRSFCKGQYEKFIVYENERVVMFNEILSPGTYCLPKGLENCDLKTATPIYSINGWICVPKNSAIWRNGKFIACQSPYAIDNSLNYLFDTKSNQKLNDAVNDYYEQDNGKMRYRCSCNSRDKNDNKMIHLDDIPFQCVSDYCLEDLIHTRGVPGWDPQAKQCDCGQYSHENPNDLTSRCVNLPFQLHNTEFKGYVKCMQPKSLIHFPIFCKNMPFLEFKKTIISSNNPLEYLNQTV